MKGCVACRCMGGKAEMVVVWAADESGRTALRGWADCDSAKAGVREGQCKLPSQESFSVGARVYEALKQRVSVGVTGGTSKGPRADERWKAVYPRRG